ncbi:MAG: ferritin family protein [Nitrospina sp.]|jgi:rubrerythrin|nr:ferritin family protein [Nitrospina sp.]
MVITNSELLELSIKIEREGQRFYGELAKQVDDPKVQEFLNLMVKEEAAHEIHFKKMLETENDVGWENNEEIQKLIEENFQTDIFPSLEETLNELPRFEGLEKAFDFAIEAEKVATEFYRILGNACTDIELKTHMVLLEKAEMEHCNVVETLKKRVLEKLS